MEYQILPMGDIWQGGSFCVPTKIVENYIKLASEYQLKALMLILASNGRASSREIAKALGCTESDADDFLDFWVEEGVLSKDGEVVAPQPVQPQMPAEPVKASREVKPVKKVEAMPIPTLSPKDIVNICRDNEMLTDLLRNAQEVMAKTLSHAEQELIINMVTYYGLPEEIVITILHYYKGEKEKGKAVGTAYIAAMAKNWSEDGITTLSAAEERLRDIESSDALWKQILEFSGLRHRNPTVKQREMIKAWADDFSMEMIGLACDAMRENTDRPSLQYVDRIIKNWRKKGIKTPSDVLADNENHSGKAQSTKKPGKLQGTPNFDLNEITKKAMYDDDYDI